jgi:Gas vesicle protein K
VTPGTGTPQRIPADSGRGLGRLVIAILDIVRDLLERQALRRVDSGSLTPEQVERLGQALIALDRQFAELREVLTERAVPPAADEPAETSTTRSPLT